MTFEEEKSCKEKPDQPREEAEDRRVMIGLAVTLGLTILIAGGLDLLAKGVSLGFVIPILNDTATISGIVYRVVVTAIAFYIGYIGIRDLVVERRFSVEFLMAVAALGAVYLGFLLEGATVLFLYCIAEYFEGYIEDRARRTVEKLSQFMPDKARVLADGQEESVNVT